jgi:hypothetical protein
MRNLIIMAVLVFPLSAWARLGETVAECNARYGTQATTVGAMAPATQGRGWKKNGMIIMAQFMDGRCHLLVIGKEEQNILGNSAEMSQVERQALLDANSNGSTWKERKGLSLEYERADGGAMATYNNVGNRMTFFSVEFSKKMDEAKAAKEKKALEGF